MCAYISRSEILKLCANFNEIYLILVLLCKLYNKSFSYERFSFLEESKLIKFSKIIQSMSCIQKEDRVKPCNQLISLLYTYHLSYETSNNCT